MINGLHHGIVDGFVDHLEIISVVVRVIHPASCLRYSIDATIFNSESVKLKEPSIQFSRFDFFVLGFPESKGCRPKVTAILKDSC